MKTNNQKNIKDEREEKITVILQFERFKQARFVNVAINATKILQTNENVNEQIAQELKNGQKIM